MNIFKKFYKKYIIKISHPIDENTKATEKLYHISLDETDSLRNMDIYITYEYNNYYKGWNIVTNNELILVPFEPFDMNGKIYNEQEEIAKIINKYDNSTVYYDKWHFPLKVMEFLKEKCPNANFLNDRYVVYEKINKYK